MSPGYIIWIGWYQQYRVEWCRIMHSTDGSWSNQFMCWISALLKCENFCIIVIIFIISVVVIIIVIVIFIVVVKYLDFFIFCFFRYQKKYIYFLFLAGGQKKIMEGRGGVSGYDMWKYAQNHWIFTPSNNKNLSLFLDQ